MSFGSVKMTHVDGTMHHLGVKESDISKNVILVPDPMSVERFAAYLDNAEKKGDYREYVTYTGSFHGKPLTVMSSGFGCMPMAIAVEELNHLGVRRILCVQACPAIAPECKPGTVCAAKGAVRSEGASCEYIDACYPAVPDIALLERFCRVEKTAQLCVFRSHDCADYDSPYTEGGMQRVEHWAKLGVDLMDGSTSSMYVISSILGVSTASVAVAQENYATGEKLTQAQTEQAMKQLFLAAAEALTCD